MRIKVLQLLAGVVPMVTALVMGRSSEVADVHERTQSIEARDTANVIIDLSSDFNNARVLSLIDQNLPDGSRRTSGIQLAWMPWAKVPGPVKPRATKKHKDTDPVIRITMAIHVNTPAGCSAVNGHIIYYLFPDNSEFNFKGLIDSWDTLTDNWSICQGAVNDKLRQVVPTKIPLIQSLVDYRLAQLPNEHFPSFRLLPANGNGNTQLILERSTIVSRWSDLCMDVKGASTANGALIQQWGCYDTNNQRWDKVPTTDDYFLIRNRNSGKYLAVVGSSSANGAQIGQWDYNPADPTFEWRSVNPGANSVGAKWLINRRSGKCVETPNWSTAAGTVLSQLDCVGGWKHFWYGL
jgi:hypothetical protein